MVFCSFETLRDELNALRRDKGAARRGCSGEARLAASPLAALGFWRIVIDEAQVVSNTASAAAVMCSALWRRQAWVVTGTPVNSRHVEIAAGMVSRRGYT